MKKKSKEKCINPVFYELGKNMQGLTEDKLRELIFSTEPKVLIDSFISGCISNLPEDSDFVKEIFNLSDSYSLAKYESLRRIKDVDFLKSIIFAKAFPNEIKREAINQIDSKEILIDLLKSSKVFYDQRIITAILDKMDQNELYDIVSSNMYFINVKDIALEKINDKHILEKLTNINNEIIAKEAEVKLFDSKNWL